MIRIGSATLALVLGACAGPSLLLLPTEDGHPSAVAVLESNGRPSDRVIDRENSFTRLAPDAVSRPVAADRLAARDADLLGALPPPASRYTLFFDEGLTRLTPESRPVLDAIRRDIAGRPGVEVQVTGHTDTVGSDADNDRLSLRRAERIRDFLISQGLDASVLTAVGRGERDLVEATGDNRSNPANRRAEVIVR